MNNTTVLFPGYGSEYVGMGKILYDNYPNAREIFDLADKKLGYKLSDVIFYGSEKELSAHEVWLPAILTTSVAFYTILINHFDFTVDNFAGFGLGEITALVCAGALDFGEGVRLVSEWGALIENEINVLGNWTNLKVIAENGYDVRELIDNLVEKNCDVMVTGYISKDCVLICVSNENEGKVMNELIDLPLEVEYLPYSLPLYTKHMTPVYQKLIQKVNIKIDSNMNRVITSISKRRNKTKKDTLKNIMESMCLPVYWEDMIQELCSLGSTKFIDVGPSRMVSSFLKHVNKDLEGAFLDYPGDAYYCLSIFQEKKLFNKKYLLGRMLATAVSIPNKNFDEKEYNAGVVLPYSNIKKQYGMQSVITDKDLFEAKGNLITIMKTKGSAQEEINRRIQKLQDETLITIQDL